MKRIRVGNSRPDLIHSLKNDDGSPIDITSATVTGNFEFLDGTNLKSRVGVPRGDPLLGGIDFSFATTDFEPALTGVINFWWRIVFSGGDILDSDKKNYRIVLANK